MYEEQNQFFIDIIDKGISLYWCTLAQARHMKLYAKDIEWAMSDDRSGPERIFNVRISPVDAKKRIDEIISEIEKDLIPNSLLITQNSTPSNIVELLQSENFNIDKSSPGMVLDLLNFEPDPCTSRLIQIKRVGSEADLYEWVKIVNNDFTIMSYEQFYDIYSLPDTYLYLSLYDSTPVGNCMVIVNKNDDNEFATLEMVNTLKEFQRKGIGTAMLKYIFNELKKEGIKYVTLRSSEEGIRLYTKLGFMEYCKRILATYDMEEANKRNGV